MELEASGDITPTADLETVDVGSATATDRDIVIQFSDCVRVGFNICEMMIIGRWLAECHSKELGSSGPTECSAHGAVEEEIDSGIEQGEKVKNFAHSGSVAAGKELAAKDATEKGNNALRDFGD